MLPERMSDRRVRSRNRERSTTVRWLLDLVRTELISGAFPDGVLPSEDAMIKAYDVSRGVVRQVLQVLQEQGMIERVRGAGTFALTPSVWSHEIDVSRDLSQEVNEQGVRAVIRTSHVSTHPATEYVASRLEIATGDPVVIMESSTTLDGFPLSIRTAFMIGTVFGRLADDHTIDLDRSPYDVIADVLGEPPGVTELLISSSTADRIVADALGISEGAALLDSTRVIRDRRGTALEHSISHARADRLIMRTLMRVEDGTDLTAAAPHSPLHLRLA